MHVLVSYFNVSSTLGIPTLFFRKIYRLNGTGSHASLGALAVLFTIEESYNGLQVLRWATHPAPEPVKDEIME